MKLSLYKDGGHALISISHPAGYLVSISVGYKEVMKGLLGQMVKQTK